MIHKKFKKAHKPAGAPSASRKEVPPEEAPIITYTGPDYEVKAMLERIAEMKRDLESKLTNIYAKAAISKLDVKEFLENPDNFSRADWEKVQRNKNFLIDQISLIFTPESAIKRPAKSKEKLTKERRGKTLGARKKWIHVR